MSLARTISIFIVTSFVLMLNQSANAGGFKLTPKLCKEYGLGKNWYCGEEKREGSELKRPQEIMNMKIPGEQKAELLNQLWEVSRKRSVMDGKKEDLEIFLETNYLISKLSLNFANNAQSIVETNPVYSGETSILEADVNKEEADKEKARIIEMASKNFIMGFIYNAECPICHKQMPILMHFKKATGFKILGITESEPYFEGLDHNITDTDIRSNKMIKAFPTLILMDNRSGKKIFISKGIITFDSIIEKIVARVKELEK